MKEKPREIKMHGEDYRLVAGRVVDFRESSIYKGWALETEIVYHDEIRVVARAVVKDCDGIVRSTGHAEKVRDSGHVERTSAVEFAETSAVGRALGLLDRDLMGSAIASAEEMQEALASQQQLSLIDYNALVREYWMDIAEVKSLLEPKWGELENQPDVTTARGVLKDLGDDIYRAIWRAPTKGGCFTTEERKWLKEPPENAL